jgi:glycerophosphoryl diester phosphodiesterase
MRLLFILASFTALINACSTSKQVMGKTQLSYNPVIAHRGAFKKNNLPENSIAALKQAVLLKCRGSEFDVRMTADDSLIINHDPEFHGMAIEKNSYAFLSGYKLSNGEQLPTLR